MPIQPEESDDDIKSEKSIKSSAKNDNIAKIIDNPNVDGVEIDNDCLISAQSKPDRKSGE